MKELQEIQTTGWLFKVGDVYRNRYDPLHLKVTKIELKEGNRPDCAWIHFHMVEPDNHDNVVEYNNFPHRAWYINENWFK